MHLGGKLLFRFMLLLAAVCAGTIANTTAEAKSPTCRKLEAQLSTTAPGTTAQVRRYDRAIARQENQLGIVRSRMSQARCGFGILGSRVAQCARLRKSADSMEKNLAKLRRERGRTNPGRGAQRSRIRAALKANKCHTNGPTEMRKKIQKRVAEKNNPSVQKLRRPGTMYQTMCVRICDGYYFPISFSVSKDRFSRDQRTCEARCPGADVALYAHEVLNEESEEMISVSDGTPYRELPKAFSYRGTGVSRAECGCRKTRSFSIIAGDKAIDAHSPAVTGQTSAHNRQLIAKEVSGQETSSFYVAVPPKRPQQHANTATPRTQEEMPLPRSIDDEAAQRRVRIVGPAFLPDPKGAIDLQAPAPALVP
ncbi:DUF2865 domain-containing protein [uncultured Nitratireductor sp.]|uniref:DUF2865 domain-containing protein n=1 Tax=uncultured Nitratireductor sp. TaxID=520953 RepID=UPI0025D7BE2A|nr:DUF2865 domain-containing protein [uncultured Nitratireductor sp.]